MNDYKLAIKVADENQLREICAALMAERDAFAAQVEVLQKDKSDLLAYVNDAEKWFNRHDPNGYFSPKRETAQHHLRELRAAYEQAGYVAACLTHLDEPMQWIEAHANKHADSIRQEMK